MGWIKVEDQAPPRDDTILVVIAPTAKHPYGEKMVPATHAMYSDEAGRMCNAGTWQPDPSIADGMFRVTYWQLLPAPPTEEPR